MELQAISGIEYTVENDGPFLDGDFIRNILVLGNVSKNAWNANRTSGGDPNGPRRSFKKVISATEEIAKLDGKPAYMLHKPAPRSDEDLIGAFTNPRPCDKGLRMDLQCRKITGSEEYVPQIVALRDNVDKKRPFGGFSPAMDFMVLPATGDVERILGCESIDLVPQPATVKSAVESEEEPAPEYALKAEHLALEERVKACECYMAAQKTSGSEQVVETRPAAKPAQRSAEPPAPKTVSTSAKSFREFIRS